MPESCSCLVKLVAVVRVSVVHEQVVVHRLPLGMGERRTLLLLL